MSGLADLICNEPYGMPGLASSWQYVVPGSTHPAVDVPIRGLADLIPRQGAERPARRAPRIRTRRPAQRAERRRCAPRGR